MATTPQGALHQVHTATNDVLEGYRTMLERAEPEIKGIISELTAMHARHASDLKARLSTLGHTGEDDTSFRGMMNKVAVTMRDWITGLDEGSLDAVERGERAILDIYDDAMQDWSTHDDPKTWSLLEKHYQDIDAAIAKLSAL